MLLLEAVRHAPDLDVSGPKQGDAISYATWALERGVNFG